MGHKMKFFNILQYTRVLQLKYEGLIGPGLLRVETNHWNDGNLSYTTPAVEYSCMWKSGDQKTWLVLPEELRDVGPDFYERFRQFGEEMARKVDYIDEKSELLCEITTNPTLNKRTQQALMHATNGTDEKVIQVHIFTSVEDSTYPGVLHIHSDDDNLGYFTYGDIEEELKCYWNDPSDEIYKTLKTRRDFYFGDDSIMRSVRFHYDHKDFDRDVRLVADESHESMFACMFQKTSAESVKVIDEVMERVRDEREQMMDKMKKEREEVKRGTRPAVNGDRGEGCKFAKRG